MTGAPPRKYVPVVTSSGAVPSVTRARRGAAPTPGPKQFPSVSISSPVAVPSDSLACLSPGGYRPIGPAMAVVGTVTST